MNMRSRSKIIMIASLAVTAVCTALLTLCFFTSFDAKLGYFSRNSVLPIVFMILYGAAALGALVSSFIYTKEKEAPASSSLPAPSVKIVWLCIGALLTVFALYEIISVAISGKIVSYGSAGALGKLFFGVYLIFCSVEKTPRLRSLKLFFLCFSALYPICSAMENFFNVFRPSNSVENTLSACISIAFLLYILNEARLLVYEKSKKTYLASVLLTLLTGASFSVSYIIGFAAGALTEVSRFRYSISILLISIYAISLLFSLLKNSDKTEKDVFEEVS